MYFFDLQKVSVNISFLKMLYLSSFPYKVTMQTENRKPIKEIIEYLTYINKNLQLNRWS